MTTYDNPHLHDLPDELYAKIAVHLAAIPVPRIGLGAVVCLDEGVAYDGTEPLADRAFGGIFDSLRPYRVPDEDADRSRPDWRRALHIPLPAKNGRNPSAILCPPGCTPLPCGVDVFGGYTLVLTAREGPDDADPILVLAGDEARTLFLMLHERRSAYLAQQDPRQARAASAREAAGALESMLDL